MLKPPDGLKPLNPPYEQHIVSSRVRLARNSTEFAFPPRLGKADGIALLARCERVFRNLDSSAGGPFSAKEAKLLERSFISTDETSGARVNHIDHFRIWATAPGLDLADCLRRARLIEAALEKAFPFAVSLEWGYLSPHLDNLGTGLRASVLLQLPALGQGLATRTLDAALDGAAECEGLELVRWGPAPAWLFKLANRETLGLNESVLLNKLDTVALVLLHYEREMIERRRQQRGLDFKDSAWRALGLLRNCVKLELEEAASMLAEVRLGLVAGCFTDPSRPELSAEQLNAALLALGSEPNGRPAWQRADQMRLILA